MQSKAKAYFPALLCALTPVLCFILAHAWAEIGILLDDWSYIKTAEVLARTGHLAFNGWAAPMLGWQAYFGALFVKLFGFSFTAVRLSTLTEASVTAFLLERTIVRIGVSEWNATVATLTFVLSSVYLPLTAAFLTDVSGVLFIVLCAYFCLRAVESETQWSAPVWIVLAALSSALGGTARQIAWLGVLVMVPSTLWLLRRNRRALVLGGVACILGAGFVFAAMRWFAHQPYTLPEPLIPGRIGLESLKNLEYFALGEFGELLQLLLPVLLAFAVPLRNWNRRMAAVFATGSLCFVLLGTVLSVADRSTQFHSPFSVSAILSHLLQGLNLTFAPRVRVLGAYQAVLCLSTGAAIVGFLSLAANLVAGTKKPAAPGRKKMPVSWQKLGIVLGPFTFAYLGLLMPRAAFGQFYARYLLPVAAICLLVLSRYYQERVEANLPMASFVLVVLIGALSVVYTHDKFAMYRGWAAATDEIRSAGVPATAIWGPMEFEGWTEIEEDGHIDDPKIRVPDNAYTPPRARMFPPTCRDDGDRAPLSFLDLTPAIKPVYATSSNPEDCDGPAGFPPVIYRTWMTPHNHLVYIVRAPAALSR
ncbi:MAG: ArnT family glycosyltransferase [Terracidiphilus sp.]